MSRGPGRWQQALLDAVGQYDVVPVATIAHNTLGRDATRSEMVACRRAARRLAEDGQARAIYLGQCPRCDELSEKVWHCRRCGLGVGVRRVLVLTPTTGTGADIGSITSSHRYPQWLSVAPVRSESEATLSEPP